MVATDNDIISFGPWQPAFSLRYFGLRSCNMLQQLLQSVVVRLLLFFVDLTWISSFLCMNILFLWCLIIFSLTQVKQCDIVKLITEVYVLCSWRVPRAPLCWRLAYLGVVAIGTVCGDAVPREAACPHPCPARRAWPRPAPVTGKKNPKKAEIDCYTNRQKT